MAKNKEANKEANKESFLNPFDKGVTYADFLASIPEGVSVREHCNGKLSEQEIEGLEIELSHYEKNKK